LRCGKDAGGGCLKALIERAEDHHEDGAEGPVKTADRIRKRVRMLHDGSGNPGMGELQQQRPARAQNITASLFTCQVIDRGPNMPESEPAAAPRTRLSSRSRLSALTISSGSCSVRAFILVASIPNSAETEREHQ